MRFYASVERTNAAGSARSAYQRLRTRNSGSNRGRSRVRPWMWETALFALLLLIFLVFLRYLTREPVANPDGGQASVDASHATHLN